MIQPWHNRIGSLMYHHTDPRLYFPFLLILVQSKYGQAVSMGFLHFGNINTVIFTAMAFIITGQFTFRHVQKYWHFIQIAQYYLHQLIFFAWLTFTFIGSDSFTKEHKSDVPKPHSVITFNSKYASIYCSLLQIAPGPKIHDINISCVGERSSAHLSGMY